MPKTNANGISINYEQQGTGEPLILIPFTTADHACYAFQVPAYAKHFCCLSLDPRGAGESDKPEGPYSIELFADDVAGFMQAMGIAKAHVGGLSFGAAVAMWLGAKYPDKVLSLSLHGGWTKSDPFLKTVVASWQVMARAVGSVPEMAVQAILPWCFTPETYASRPEFIDSIAQFIRSRPAQPLASFIAQANAVMAHDVEAQLARIAAPTLVTAGRLDMLTARFAERIKAGIRASELVMFDGCAHAHLYEKVEAFNEVTLAFLQRQTGAAV
jgi:pimeloyl-ACP methyl ester carboxylesterase